MAPRWTVLLLLGTLLPAAARPSPPPDLYERVVERIGTSYLWRDSLRAGDLLQAAADRLERDLVWLVVEPFDDGSLVGVTLHHGDGRYLGAVSAFDLEALPDSLRALERAVEGAAAPIDADPPLSVRIADGLTAALDRHSRVLYGDRLQAFNKRLAGSFGGIGARVSSKDHWIVIEEVFPDTPAARGGLRSGDRLVRIDGVSTLGMSVTSATNAITGEPGSPVTVTVERSDPDGGSRALQATLVRAEIRTPNVTWTVTPGGFASIKLEYVSEQTVPSLQEALVALRTDGSLERGLILDLRGNSGGSMRQSARAVDQFVTSGEVVRTEGPGGAPVEGLIPWIRAEDDGDEPPVPVVVLTDEHTASGAEIIAGALRELGPAVLVGDVTYGKGTVQKAYNLSDDLRLKLTIAEYKVADGLAISGTGLTPDLRVAVVQVHGSSGPSLPSFADGPAVLSVLAATASPAGDPVVEVAERVLALEPDADRASLLASLGVVHREMRKEHAARLEVALRAQGVDWSAAPWATDRQPQVSASVKVLGTASAGTTATLEARVTNRGAEDLHHVRVRLASADRTWHDRVILIGLVRPGATEFGRLGVDLPETLVAREEEVLVSVEADGRPPADAAPALLSTRGSGAPPVAVDVALARDPSGKERAEVQVVHGGPSRITGLRVRFEHPEDAPVELGQYDATVPPVDPGAVGRAWLPLRVLGPAQTLPLRLVVESDAHGELASWPLVLPVDGTPVHLEAPDAQVVGLPTSTPAGTLPLDIRVSDDRKVAHIVVWLDDEKVAWVGGEGPTLRATVPVDIGEGRNRLSIYSEDDQGLVRWTTRYVRGLPAPVQVEAD